jgi:hypothetical protein
VTKRQNFGLMLLPIPILLFLLSYTGLYANDVAFYGALTLIALLQIAMIVIRFRYDRHET